VAPIPPEALYRTSWPTGGLVGRFYANDEWASEPAFARLDRQVAYYFHFLPLERPYTVQWTGRLFAPVTGKYRFAVKAISSASLAIDGNPIIEPSAPSEFREGEIHLAPGLHGLELRFLDNQSHSQVYLYWQPPDGAWAHVPPEVLFPPSQGAWWPVP
jgi:hypothetical protein